jgi:hypothetical protein
MPENEPWEYSLYIPNDPRAVTICRRTVRLILTMNGLIRLVDTAELLATELISNAVRHTKGPAALRLRWRSGVLRIGDWDADPEPPEPPSTLGDLVAAEDGRGLHWSEPAPTYGGGSRWPGTATEVSTCGASSLPRRSRGQVRWSRAQPQRGAGRKQPRHRCDRCAGYESINRAPT